MATAKTHLSLPESLWQHLDSTASAINCPVDQVHWVIAFSGGKDSAALAHVFAHLSLRLPNVTLAHIHHGLQTCADDWVTFAEQQAERYGFGFFSKRVDVSIGQRQSIEAQARDARYDALRGYCRDTNGVLLIAQHGDDQLETVLLQLKRGSGPKGLSAMAESQRVDGVTHIRPWLDHPQQAIDDYVAVNHVDYISDPSNTDSRFDRNFLRHDIVPLLTQRWPGLAKAVGRSARLCAQQTALIEEQAAGWLSAHQTPNGQLPVKPLLALSGSWQAETLRYWCSSLVGAVPSEAQLKAFLASLSSDSDKLPLLQFQRFALRRYNDSVFVGPETAKLLPAELDTSISLTQDQPYPIPQWQITISITDSPLLQSANQTVFAVPMTDNLRLHRLDPAASEQLNPQKQRRNKKLFKEWKVPPWCRDNCLGVFIDGYLHAIVHQEGVSLPSDNGESSTTSTDTRAYLVVSHRTKLDPPV